MKENQRFDASYHRLFGHGVGIGSAATPFFESFYRNFLTDPHIGAFFSKTDMDHQVAMLRKSLFTLIAFYATNRPNAELERLADIHHRLGIADEHYDLWLDALITTVREHDSEIDEATELAWCAALAPGLTFMRLYSYFSDDGPSAEE